VVLLLVIDLNIGFTGAHDGDDVDAGNHRLRLWTGMMNRLFNASNM
jgi:hypothetical protein